MSHARFAEMRRFAYLRTVWFAALLAGCSVYGDDLFLDGGGPPTSGAGGSTIGGAGGSGGLDDNDGGLSPDASAAGSGGSTAGRGGSTGKGGSGKGGTSGTGATGGVGGAAGSGGATGGSTGTGGSPTGGAAGADGGATGGTGGATGGAGGATAGTGGTGGVTGGTGGATGGKGGTMDAAPEAPPPPGAVFAVGSFTKLTSTGSQSVPHTLGQVPKALLLWTIGKTNETLSSGFYYGVGISDASTSFSLATSTRDGVSPSQGSRRVASKAITLVHGSASIVAEADLPSWSSTNFQLTWTTNDSQPYVIHYLVIGGPQVSAKVVNWQAPTSPGQKSVTGLGFQPETVLHLYAGAAFDNPSPHTDSSAVIGIGAMDRTGAQWAIQASDVNGANPTVTSRSQRNDAAIYMYSDSGSVVVTKEASFVNMTSGGFTLNFGTANSSASQIFSLALGGLKAGVGTFNKSTASAPASQTVTAGFRPGAVFMTSYHIASQTAQINQPICSFGVGASDGTNEASSAIVAHDNASPAAVDGQDKTSKAFIKMNTPPLDSEADMASFGPTGFTLNWTTNDSVASQMCFLALGAP